MLWEQGHYRGDLKSSTTRYLPETLEVTQHMQHTNGH